MKALTVALAAAITGQTRLEILRLGEGQTKPPHRPSTCARPPNAGI